MMKKAPLAATALFAAALFLLAPALSLPAFAAQAAPTSAAAIIEKLKAAYAGMRGFKADFTQELMHQESHTTESRQGTLLFQKPLLVRWETKAPQEELLLVGKDFIWNYHPDEALAYKYSLELAQDSRSIILVVTGQSPLNKDFDVERLENEEGLVHLMLYPKEPTAQLTEAQLWIDPATSLIRRAQAMDFYGNTNRITFTNLTPNASMEASAFTFTPPKDTEVEDHTDMSKVTQSPLYN